MSLHEQCVGATDEWYTPPYVFDALGCSFDMDVAHPGFDVVQWIPAVRLSTQRLPLAWRGFVWMNPPFGARNGIVPWLSRFLEHRNGIALTPDRTSAPWWQAFAKQMESVLFVSPKIKFIDAAGRPGRSPAQGTTLMALGERGVEALTLAAEAGLGVAMTRIAP
jgi:DNA N-6-adenine-methyltransferase (Dam)